MNKFELVSHYTLSQDQERAVNTLTAGIIDGKKNQVLLGVTGSGKTFTMAHTIAKLNKPAIIMAHNKTLAAQLYSEMKSFFPNNAVEYFVSYYDYYQPEAYIPKTDIYIEKDSQINERIDRMRHSATRALFERKDVIVVASVSCIYGLGSPEWYLQMIEKIEAGQKISRQALMSSLIELQYKRNDIDFKRGTFRARGDAIDIFPSHYEDAAWRINFWCDEIESIIEFDSLTGEKLLKKESITVYANTHYITPKKTIENSIKLIQEELRNRVQWFADHGNLIEAQRIEQRTKFDLEMMLTAGSCKGIENYSRYLSGRAAGQPPPTLFEYFPKDALLFVDESHVTTPQIGGMYNGDRARKITLVEHGFRLPSALDNRPLKFEEWEAMRPQTVFVSATPAPLELSLSGNEYVEQIIRPTGLIDPICIVRPVATQIDDLLIEAKATVEKGYRVLVTTLTKKMAEQLASYLQEIGIKAVYLHSEIDTLERIEIIRDLRLGNHDVLVGVNLLREGLDIPECGMVAILDADKEGFLRSRTSLIQTIGRAARNVNGKVLLYADRMTNSLKAALEETERRRQIQIAHNEEHGITPRTITKAVHDMIEALRKVEKKKIVLDYNGKLLNPKKLPKEIEKLKKEMKKAATDLNFERAAEIRDAIKELESYIMEHN